MPFELEKRHIRTIGSSQDLSVLASAWVGLWANCSSSASNQGYIFLVNLALMFFLTRNPFSWVKAMRCILTSSLHFALGLQLRIQLLTHLPTRLPCS
jgi:hypothetical protein